jgi:hypothetical protein
MVGSSRDTASRKEHRALNVILHVFADSRKIVPAADIGGFPVAPQANAGQHWQMR